MTSPETRLDREAAEIFLALREPNASTESILSALGWLEEHPEHQAAYARVERFWEICGDLTPPLSNHHRPWLTKRFRLVGTFTRENVSKVAGWGMVLLVSAAVVFGVHSLQPSSAPSQAIVGRFATSIGQTRRVSLPDGSTLQLAGASSVTVNFQPKLRWIALTDGEALFTVTRNVHRPFVVTTGSGSTRVLGTVFNVHRKTQGTTVTVVDGTVEVTARGPRSVVRTPVGKGMQVTYTPDGTMSPARPVNVAHALAWRHGKLRFENQRLSDIVAELGRYSSKPIEIESPRIGSVLMSGTVRVGEIEDWLKGAASITGFEIDTAEEGVIRLRDKRSQDLARLD